MPKELVLLEFFLNNLRFAADCKFSTEKTSAFFSIMRANHEAMVRGFMRLDQSLLYFKELLLLHAVQRPPYSVGIFSLKDVTLITDYVNRTYGARARRFTFVEVALRRPHPARLHATPHPLACPADGCAGTTSTSSCFSTASRRATSSCSRHAPTWPRPHRLGSCHSRRPSGTRCVLTQADSLARPPVRCCCVQLQAQL